MAKLTSFKNLQFSTISSIWISSRLVLNSILREWRFFKCDNNSNVFLVIWAQLIRFRLYNDLTFPSACNILMMSLSKTKGVAMFFCGPIWNSVRYSLCLLEILFVVSMMWFFFRNWPLLFPIIKEFKALD